MKKCHNRSHVSWGDKLVIFHYLRASETWPDKRANIVHNADFDSWNGFYNQTEFSYSYGKEQIKETVRDYVL
jgi:hypothetical protein